MRSDEVEELLEHIRANIARIHRHTAHMTVQAFEESELVNDAVERALMRISEAAYRLGDRADQLCPGIPWHAIRGLGNRLRHGYDSITSERIWNTVTNDLPPLDTAVRQALAQLDQPPPSPGI